MQTKITIDKIMKAFTLYIPNFIMNIKSKLGLKNTTVQLNTFTSCSLSKMSTLIHNTEHKQSTNFNLL